MSATAGVSSITVARIYEGQLKPNNRGGEENSLSLEQLPYLALSNTYSANQQTPDSAPTMTAIITGVKTNDGELSVGMKVACQEKDARMIRDHKVKTLFEQAEETGDSFCIWSSMQNQLPLFPFILQDNSGEIWIKSADGLVTYQRLFHDQKQVFHYMPGDLIAIVFEPGCRRLPRC